MTKSYNKKILRGIKIEGTTYCSPSGSIEDSESVSEQNKDNLKALEDFWYQKGFGDGEQSGHEKGYQEGLEKGSAQGEKIGKEKGIEEGKAAGMAQGAENSKEELQKEFEQSLLLFEKMAESLALEKEHLFQKMKPELIQFALSVCEQVLEKELQNPETLKAHFEKLINKASPIIKSDPINIHLPKASFTEHREVLESAKTSFKQELINFTEDESLSSGSMRIETNLGLINFDIPRLMKEFEASALTEYVEEI